MANAVKNARQPSYAVRIAAEVARSWEATGASNVKALAMSAMCMVDAGKSEAMACKRN